MFVSNLDPIAFSLGPVSIRWYGLLFSLGFILGYLMMQLFFRKKNYKTEDLDRLLFYIFIGTVVGARLAHCFIYEPDFYLSHPGKILKIWEGGLASHGGTVGVILAVLFFMYRTKWKYNFLELADMICVPTALVCSMIRLGNFFNSEILGIPTNSDYGIVFAKLGEDFARHPAQLYEAVSYFLIFLLLLAVYTFVKRPKGLIFGLLFTLAFIARFAIEPFKVEQADYSTNSIFNVGQFLSIPFIILGIAIIVYAYIKDRNNRK
ncbi:MAG: prolipoprotein diacylglyceryl transferase [Succinivibrio sp.]